MATASCAGQITRIGNGMNVPTKTTRQSKPIAQRNGVNGCSSWRTGG
jgi:hypothetical protein